MNIQTRMIGHASLAKVLAALGLATLAAPAAEPWPRFSSTPECRVEFTGDNLLHGWKIHGSVINGSLEAGPGFPIQPGQPVKTGRVEVRIEFAVPIHSLTNGSQLEGRWARSLLQVEKHPDIVCRLDEMILLSAPTADQSFYQAEARGTLAGAGATNKFSAPIRITILADQRMKISGDGTVKLSDFKIVPPALKFAKDAQSNVLPDVKASRDEVGVTIDWVLAPVSAASSAK